jgi:hypothetical protein
MDFPAIVFCIAKTICDSHKNIRLGPFEVSSLDQSFGHIHMMVRDKYDCDRFMPDIPRVELLSELEKYHWRCKENGREAWLRIRSEPNSTA